jgi:hypothetical protein
MSEPKNIIYGFTDPTTLELRYVGRSSVGSLEPRAHIYNARGGKRGCPYCYNMLRALFARGLTPVIEVIEALPDDATDDLLDERERWWIALGRAWGCRLTNMTNGGGGLRGYRHTDEMRERSRARCARPEVKAKMSATARTAQSRPEVRARISAGIRAAMARSETKAKMSASLRAANARPEVKARHGAASRAVLARPGERLRRGAA